MSGPGADGNERVQSLMMAALDGEISPAEQEELDRLMTDPAVRREWERMRRVQEVTKTMRFREPPPEMWQDYWVSVYNRAERGIGWILVSAGAMVLLGYGAWEFVRSFFGDADVPWFIKASVTAVLIGGIVLVVSVAREKLFVWRKDPYREVQR